MSDSNVKAVINKVFKQQKSLFISEGGSSPLLNDPQLKIAE